MTGAYEGEVPGRAGLTIRGPYQHMMLGLYRPIVRDIGNVSHGGAVAPTFLSLYGGVKQYQKGRKRLEIFADGTTSPSPPCNQARFYRKYFGAVPSPKISRIRVAIAEGESIERRVESGYGDGCPLSSPPGVEWGGVWAPAELPQPRPETHCGVF